MTCIAAYIDTDGTIYMGADSAGVSGYSIAKRKDPKVFINGPMVIGFTSSFRMGQLLQYKLNIPEHPSNMDTMRYMVTVFVDAVRECLKEGGYASVSNNQEEGGTFLVGYKGRLFCIEGDFQVGESVHNFDAVGCGRDLALGSLYTTYYMDDLTPYDKVIHALNAAEQFSGGVSRPFNILKLGPGTALNG